VAKNFVHLSYTVYQGWRRVIWFNRPYQPSHSGQRSWPPYVSCISKWACTNTRKVRNHFTFDKVLIKNYTITTTVKIFADDVKLCVKIMNDVDVCVLQDAVDALCRWAEVWQLSISTDKGLVFSILANVFQMSLFLLTVHYCHMLLFVVIYELPLRRILHRLCMSIIL